MGQFTLGTSEWRKRLVPASFRAVSFYIERDSQAGGRRVAVHQFAKRDIPFAEDMGRQAKRWSVTGYVIGSAYTSSRDFLLGALDAEGAGSLVHPTLGTVQAVCLEYVTNEVREKGGIATFEMTFVEAGSALPSAVGANTAAQAQTAAQNLLNENVKSLTSAIGGLQA